MVRLVQFIVHRLVAHRAQTRHYVGAILARAWADLRALFKARILAHYALEIISNT